MPRRSNIQLASTVLGESALDSSIEGLTHNLLVNTRLLRLDKPSLRVLERLDLMAQFIDGPAAEGKSSRDTGALLRAGIRAYVKRQGRSPRPLALAPEVRRNLDVLSSVTGLGPVDEAVLVFLMAREVSAELADFTNTLDGRDDETRARIIASAIDAPVEAVRQALRPQSPLPGSGLVSVNSGNLHNLELKPGLVGHLLAPGLDVSKLLRAYFPEDRPSDLTWDDFQHLGESTTLVKRVLDAALASKRAGVNILFYGATGTGKSELARLVAQQCGVRIHPAGRVNESGESATPRERLSSLLLGHRLLRGEKALLLFDELEDLFNRDASQHRSERARAQMSKQWFNELLDTNPIPTVWISNSVDGVDSAFLRRFTYAVEFRPIGARQRLRVLERHLGAASLPAEDVRALADRFQVSAAQLSTAVRTAKLLGAESDRALLERLLTPSEKLVQGTSGGGHQRFDARTFRLDALNTREDLVALADSLERWQPSERPGLSFCLYGPPGTGKSEFAKYLAHRMGRRLLYRRVSDLQSCWVGETEKNIADAFREAEQDDAVLLFDEADSFLHERRAAQRSWEVSQVNEFLQQLEAFRGVVICTTNLWKGLDEASMRRFVFKVEFRFLEPTQAWSLFEVTLAPLMNEPLSDEGRRRTERQLAGLHALAPGDFAAVSRRLRAVNRRVTSDEAVALLEAEVAVKQGAPRAVGFAQVN